MSNQEESLQGPSDTSHISPVAMKIPPFWPKNVLLWFHQIECQFSIHGISKETTKYNYVMSSLDSEVASHLSDFIAKPLSSTPYSDLKTRLCSEFEVSEHVKLKQLTTEVNIGDKKPSTLLREMRTLAGTQVTDNFLKVIFLQRLPNHIRTALAASQTDSLDNLAKLGDQIAEISAIDDHVYAQGDPAQSTDRIAILEKQVNELAQSVQELIIISKGSTPATSNRKYQFKQKDSQVEICWYHNKFGENAKKCIQPCSFSPNSLHNKGNFLPRH